MDFDFQFFFAFFLGIGLAASAGFRVFVPLFVLSLAAHLGADLGFTLDSNWQWVGDWPALITLGVATLVEILAYFIPWVDNALDAIAVPLATVAGTLLMGISMSDVDSQVIQWGLAIIAGGGTAAAIKSTAAGTRAVSSASTLGVGNVGISTTETAASGVLSLLAIWIPIIAFLLVMGLLFGVYKMGTLFWKRRKKSST